MSNPNFSCKFLLCVGLMAGGASPLAAADVQLHVERIDLGVASLGEVQLDLSWPTGADTGSVELRAAKLDAPDAGYHFRDVLWRCTLLRKGTQGFGCQGTLKARGQPAAQLAISWESGLLDAGLQASRGTFRIAFGADDNPLRIVLTQVPVGWLQPVLATAWNDGRFTSGSVDAQLALQAGNGFRLTGPVTLRALGLDSIDGRVAAAGLNLEGQIDYRQSSAQTTLTTALDVNGGEVLAGAFYASLPQAGARLELDIAGQGDSIWQVRSLRWRDPKVLSLDLEGRISSADGPMLRELQAHLSAPDLAVTGTRYLESILATMGLPGLVMKGSVEGDVRVQADRMSMADLMLSSASVRDSAGRFELNDAQGTLRWNAGTPALDSDLSWASAAIHGIALGSAEVPLQSVSGGVALRRAVNMAALGGRLGVARFSWQPASGDGASDSLVLGLSLESLELSKLSESLGWPRFGGEISGEIPGVRYVDHVLQLEGGLRASVFDGSLQVGALTLERPFGVAPTLTAQIDFTGLDLKPLTSVFGFGEITGRLDGYIHDLRLVDWSPVAFDADLHTSTSTKGPRRLSQRAVQDLSSVGGSGVAAGIQNQMLKLFDSFGYARIGLKCRLANNVCHMDGVDSSGDGYTIVEGSGLPRISVIGHQRKVDWPVLVARLKAATEGQTPIIN